MVSASVAQPQRGLLPCRLHQSEDAVLKLCRCRVQLAILTTISWQVSTDSVSGPINCCGVAHVDAARNPATGGALLSSRIDSASGS
eukprot:SAG31_NODE_476_length_15154_cov_24.796878_7_plen_86_part_00